MGHGELASAITLLVTRWDWGIKFLVEEGHDAAEALTETRSTYEQAEDAAATAIKRVAHLVGGNPLEEAGAWDDKSVGEVAGEFVPDWSAQSFAESGQRTAQQFEGVTGWDLNGDGRAGGGGA